MGLIFVLELSLAELGCATSSLETVLLSFLHSGVTCEKTCSLESSTVCLISEKQCSCDAVTDSASLTGNTTTVYVSNDIKLTNVVCEVEGLIYDELECFKTKVVVNVSAVDCNYTSTGYCRSTAKATVKCITTSQKEFPSGRMLTIW